MEKLKVITSNGSEWSPNKAYEKLRENLKTFLQK